LTNYYVHPTCTPTRAALLTGRYAANVGLPMAFIPGSPGGLDPSIPLLPEYLASVGYKNYLVGKWHLGNSKESFHPLKRGFHEFYGLLGGGINFYTKQCGSGRLDWWRGWEPEYENKTHATKLLNDEALRVVDSHLEDPKSQPFFLYLAHPAPHDPLLAEARHEEQCKHIVNRARRLSCALVAGVDEGMGLLKERLTRAGVLDDTVIVFSSDNGGVPYAGALNYPFRGSKATVYEGGVRSPGFLHAPALLGEGRAMEGIAHVTDFLPTLTSIVTTTTNSTPMKMPQKLDGVDLLPALLSRSASPRLSVHLHRDPALDSQAYRRGPWKLIVGHHLVPFIFTKVYNETADERVGFDGGSWRGVVLQLMHDLIDLVIGEENALFVKYMIWRVVESAQVGGIANLRTKAALSGSGKEGMFDFDRNQGVRTCEPMASFPSDLNFWRHHDSSDYPTVSLFNLEDDPQEERNLAASKPKLVEELLREAELVVREAPPSVRGDMAQVGAPVGPQEGGIYSTLASLGTRHQRVTPFGPFYLPSSADPSSIQCVPAFLSLGGRALAILAKLLLTALLPPTLILLCICRRSSHSHSS